MIAVLVVSACASMPTMKSVAGTYEGKKDGDTYRVVLLENGIVESYENGERSGDFDGSEWKIADGELHMILTLDESITVAAVFKTSKDSSITWIDIINEDGEREGTQKEEQITLKKIK